MKDTKTDVSLREHMKRIRANVPAASCARDSEKMRRAARVRWDKVKKDTAQSLVDKPVA